MTTLRSPSSSTNGPPPKKGVFSSSSSRRPSISSASSGGMQLPQGIGYSPGSSTTYYTTPSSPAGPGSGIPALRTLRSLLPFGPGSSHSKSSNAAQTSSPSSTSASPNTSVVSRSPFSGFGSVRKSITKDRERKSSLSNDALSSPVIAIDKQGDDSGIRRSASLSNIEKPLPREPDFGGFSNTPFRQESSGSFSSRDTRTLGSGFTLRTPSPGPPLSVELSTIIEADSSGVSKHFADLPVPSHTPSLPHSRSSSPHPPSRRPSPSPRDYLHPFRKTSGGSNGPTYQQQQQPNADSAELDPDTSDLLHVSASEVANQVRDALRKSTSSSKSGEPSWRDVSKTVVIIDADEHPEVAKAMDNIANTTFNLDTVDPDLLALLSPNAQSEKTQLPTAIAQLTGRRQSTAPKPSSASPTTPTFSETSRLPKARHSSSFLPRTSSTRLSDSHSRSPSASPSTPQFTAPTPSPTTPKPSSSSSTPPEKGKAPVIAVNGFDDSRMLASPSSPPASPPSTVTSTPAAPRRTFTLSRSTETRTGAARLFSPPSLSVPPSASTSHADETSPNNSGLTSNSKPPRVSTRTLRQVMLSVSTSRHSHSKDTPSSTSPPSPNAHSNSYVMSRGSLDSRRPMSMSSTGPGSVNEIGLGRPSLDLDMRRGGSFDSRLRPDVMKSNLNLNSRSRTGSSSPERANSNPNTNGNGTATAPVTEADSTHSPEMTFEEPSFFAQAYAQGRPSIESSATRPSFDTGYSGSRPGSVARLRGDWENREREREKENQKTSSLRVTDFAGESKSVASPSSPAGGSTSASASVASAPLVPRPASHSTSPPTAVLTRMRKRSMSVQERVVSPRGLGRLGGGGVGGMGMAVSEMGVSRPGSSLSVHGGGRGGRAAGFGLDGYGGAGGSGGAVQENSVSPGSGPKLEWLGPRTAKAFRAAGLLDFDRDRDSSVGGNSTGSGGGNGNGSSSGVLAPSPLSGGASSALSRFGSVRSASEYIPQGHHSNNNNNFNGPSGHTRALSRMAFSEAGGGPSDSLRDRDRAGVGGRRGSGTFSAYAGSGGGGVQGHGHGHSHSHAHNNGLMESPTFTASSGSRGDRERDTPKSTPSTAPTSVSEGFGYLGRARDLDSRDRDREREEILSLKEKHQSDMSAVISALTDTQRTVKMLRDENTELRERLDEALSVAERDRREMRRLLDSLERENEGLRREVSELRSGRFRDRDRERSVHAPGLTPSWSGSSMSSGLRTPVGRQVNGSPLVMDSTPKFLKQPEEEEEEEEGGEVFNDTILIHDSIDDDRDDPLHDDDDHELEMDHHLTTSTPSVKRRLSNTSSIFPAPPANMTMLMHEDSNLHLGGSSRSSVTDHSQFQFSFASTTVPASSSSSATPKSNPMAAPQPMTKTSPISYRNFAGSAEPGHVLNKSITSTTSISPTTANFSMVTGSPGSLFLRPEHEILLGDMESLDLGVRGGNEELEAMMNAGSVGEDVW